MTVLLPFLTSLLALGREPVTPSSKPHGYRPRQGAPTPAPASPVETVRLQVCLSPACTADGAEETLNMMQALAPAHVIVEAGSCVSLCGSGPVVLSNRPDPSSSIKEKRVKQEDKILQLLYPDGGSPSEILEGYQLVQEANEAFSKNDYNGALKLYEKAVDVAYLSAVELQNDRDRVLRVEQQKETSSTDSSVSNLQSSTKVPVGLEWLVRARRNEATCKVQLGDIDGAMLAAQSSCNLSRNTFAESFLTLAEIYKIEGELEGEAQALEKAMSLWSDESQLDFAQKNQRRLASLRLQKIQREISLKKPKVSPEDLVSLQEKDTEVSAPTTSGAENGDESSPEA